MDTTQQDDIQKREIGSTREFSPQESVTLLQPPPFVISGSQLENQHSRSQFI